MRAEERAWFSLAPERALLAVRDFVVVPQHPGGETLSVAWGNVLAFNSAATRVRYDAITDNGSSGSPCFTADLDIFDLSVLYQYGYTVSAKRSSRSRETGFIQPCEMQTIRP
jgi:hypothetical protein